MFKTSDFNFELPDELIANSPFFPKEKTKMLLYKNSQILDLQLSNLIDFLQEGDVMVFNDAYVIKAKLTATIARNQAKLEFNLDQEIDQSSIWRALCRPAKKVKVDDILEIADDFSAQVIAKTDDGFINIKFNCDKNNLLQKLDKYGQTPLPPYIKRDDISDDLKKSDQKNYQTIYAANGTAVAAPTAGLHFDHNIFAKLEAKKIKKVFVTLNVGAGTFLPVRAEEIKDHKMHSEFFTISQESAEIINQAKASGKKIIAVGTTSLRALESASTVDGAIKPITTNTDIFIYPGYKFKIVDILMTNFHLPKSTLFMLVCAFVGKEEAFKIYNHAINNNYRFYSYGDTSLLFKS